MFSRTGSLAPACLLGARTCTLTAPGSDVLLHCASESKNVLLISLVHGVVPSCCRRVSKRHARVTVQLTTHKLEKRCGSPRKGRPRVYRAVRAVGAPCRFFHAGSSCYLFLIELHRDDCFPAVFPFISVIFGRNYSYPIRLEEFFETLFSDRGDSHAL